MPCSGSESRASTPASVGAPLVELMQDEAGQRGVAGAVPVTRRPFAVGIAYHAHDIVDVAHLARRAQPRFAEWVKARQARSGQPRPHSPPELPHPPPRPRRPPPPLPPPAV